MVATQEVQLSIIVPVYNRPGEVEELLQSLTGQTDRNFEVLIVEDGSSIPCETVCRKFKTQLNLKYYVKPNSGRSETRNYGMERALGNYFLIFDSDCILPPHYIATVKHALAEKQIDCFGGPDSANDSFSNLQKAINYSMTSFFTTGGIRGGMKKADKFSPRSFNMGISKAVFQATGGYKNMIGEDIDLSIRIKASGFDTTLLREAFVFHKRRVNFRKFFKQVNTFGKGRILLHRIHKGSLKPVHLLPMFFVLGHLLLPLLAIIFRNAWLLAPIGLYILLIFFDSLRKNKSFAIALLSIPAAYIQLFGYGLGLIEGLITGKASQEAQEELYR
ncbi:MAG: glycosyltransferase [Bacteroidales bacterium]|jgi:glycosyltransferase involved in cell wall biosynthesis|nr:glycosyltransferase [Bacteroidales bacterium]